MSDGNDMTRSQKQMAEYLRYAMMNPNFLFPVVQTQGGGESPLQDVAAYKNIANSADANRQMRDARGWVYNSGYNANSIYPPVAQFSNGQVVNPTITVGNTTTPASQAMPGANLTYTGTGLDNLFTVGYADPNNFYEKGVTPAPTNYLGTANQSDLSGESNITPKENVIGVKRMEDTNVPSNSTGLGDLFKAAQVANLMSGGFGVLGGNSSGNTQSNTQNNPQAQLAQQTANVNNQATQMGEAANLAAAAKAQTTAGDNSNFQQPVSSTAAGASDTGTTTQPQQTSLFNIPESSQVAIDTSTLQSPTKPEEWVLDHNYDKDVVEQQMIKQGIKNPFIRDFFYDRDIAPMRAQAHENILTNLFKQYLDPKATDEQKKQAMAGMALELKDPFYAENRQMAVDKFNNEQQALKDRLQLEKDRLSLDKERFAADQKYKNAELGYKYNGKYNGPNLEGDAWTRAGDSVDLSLAQPQTLAGLNAVASIFKGMTGKALIVTSGNDSDVHADGEYSHGAGWKVDVANPEFEDEDFRNAFIQRCQKLGIVVGDEYAHPSEKATGKHLDLQFAGYNGPVPTTGGKSKTTNNGKGNKTSGGAPEAGIFNDKDRSAFMDLADAYIRDDDTLANPDADSKTKTAAQKSLLGENGKAGTLGKFAEMMIPLTNTALTKYDNAGEAAIWVYNNISDNYDFRGGMSQKQLAVAVAYAMSTHRGIGMSMDDISKYILKRLEDRGLTGGQSGTPASKTSYPTDERDNKSALDPHQIAMQNDAKAHFRDPNYTQSVDGNPPTSTNSDGGELPDDPANREGQTATEPHTAEVSDTTSIPTSEDIQALNNGIAGLFKSPFDNPESDAVANYRHQQSEGRRMWFRNLFGIK